MVTGLIRPMLATTGPVPHGTGWAFEFKWDGIRAVTYVEDGEVRVMSRNDRDVTSSYPELLALAERLSTPAVLDGEIIARDTQGRPSFGELQRRMHVVQPTKQLLREVPVTYYAFDVLEVDGESLLRAPYAERRKRLEALELANGREIQLPPSFTDVDGEDVLAAAEEHGLEGVIAKRLNSIYESGRRSHAWLKTPLVRTQEVVIGGWKSGGGRRSGTLGSLLLGAYDEKGLRYLGHVGTGFTQSVLEDLHGRLEFLGRPDSPFWNEVPRDRARDAHWVEPELVGEVEFRQWTPDGRLRHSSWRGLRTDKSPQDVTAATAPG